MSTTDDAPYKQQQKALAARANSAHYLQPTIGQRIRRLNPSERYEVQQMLRSQLLRKTIKRTLLDAFHSRTVARSFSSMKQLRAAANSPESNARSPSESHERRLVFQPHVTTSEAP